MNRTPTSVPSAFPAVPGIVRRRMKDVVTRAAHRRRNWIAFVSGGCQSSFLPCLETNHEVYVMRKEGSGAVKLTHGVKWAAFPKWSP